MAAICRRRSARRHAGSGSGNRAGRLVDLLGGLTLTPKIAAAIEAEQASYRGR
jgi:hypothetical protein